MFSFANDCRQKTSTFCVTRETVFIPRTTPTSGCERVPSAKSRCPRNGGTVCCNNNVDHIHGRDHTPRQQTCDAFFSTTDLRDQTQKTPRLLTRVTKSPRRQHFDDNNLTTQSIHHRDACNEHTQANGNNDNAQTNEGTDGRGDNNITFNIHNAATAEASDDPGDAITT